MSLQKRGIFYQKGNLFPHLDAKTPKKGKYFSLEKGHNCLSPTALRAFTICIYKYIQNALFSFQGRTMANKQVNHLKATRVRTRTIPSPRQAPVEIYFPKWGAPGPPWGALISIRMDKSGDVVNSKATRMDEAGVTVPRPPYATPTPNRTSLNPVVRAGRCRPLWRCQPACGAVRAGRKPVAGRVPVRPAAGRNGSQPLPWPSGSPKPHRIVSACA